MLAGIIITICSALIWFLSEGFIAWLFGASFLFFGAVVVNGWVDGRKSAAPSKSNWLPEPPVIRHGPSGVRGANQAKVNSFITLEGDGNYSFDIVGESYYQKELSKIAGPKSEQSKSFSCEALIVHEPDNPHDKNACSVFIEGRKVGHLSKEDAKDQATFRKSPGFVLKVGAMIVGGWKSGRDEGSYGVKLDYVPRELPAGPLDKELYRFMGEKVPRNLTRMDAFEFERSLASDSRIGEWRTFRDAVEYLQSRAGREDYDLKKPSLKQIRDAYAALREKNKEDGDADSIDEGDLFEMLIEQYPDLER